MHAHCILLTSHSFQGKRYHTKRKKYNNEGNGKMHSNFKQEMQIWHNGGATFLLLMVGVVIPEE
jgi:cytochrome b subunit of formate dehydrogenase